MHLLFRSTAPPLVGQPRLAPTLEEAGDTGWEDLLFQPLLWPPQPGAFSGASTCEGRHSSR